MDIKLHTWATNVADCALSGWLDCVLVREQRDQSNRENNTVNGDENVTKF
jgi:hypothetical protein